MKARSAGTAAVAAALGAVLLLAGCGGDDGGPSSGDKIEGAKTDNKEPSGEPSEKEPGAPEFDLPDDVRVEIAEDATGDEQKDAILRDHGYALMAQQEAYAATGATPNFTQYWAGEAAATFAADFAEYRKDGVTITGLDTFYFREVTSLKDGRAVVAYCEDQSKAYLKNAGTGKVDKTPTTLDSYIDARATMEKSGDNWQVVDYQATRGSKECRDEA
ncbi:hypothetical protein [Streptomyces sp. CMB-StM0423]|uniref:hypothetical protein n=1 Tax=Streptomyces sp. CMB-StM0423 TaxID=2059884 RepID=UPI000C70F8FC|nr:hypothetical protein [Streptomyces sp. CMB-StM0423]AUH41375.1 hypothetical protein CXR04_14985 [Streptomyces sp. CMB-StM0423]